MYANLIRLNGEVELRSSLQAWLLEAKHSDNIEQTIAQGVQIKGLGVSFASKHLRMLDPHKYAVLDSVLSEGLGFALNPKGYELFMNMLAALRARHQFTQSLAQLEAGIFYPSCAESPVLQGGDAERGHRRCPLPLSISQTAD